HSPDSVQGWTGSGERMGVSRRVLRRRALPGPGQARAAGPRRPRAPQRVSGRGGLVHRVAGDADHLLALDDLDAGARLAVGVHRGGAEGLLVLVQRRPSVPGRVLDAAVVEQVEDRIVLAHGGGGEGAGLEVLEQAADRLEGVGLGRTDQAHGTALDPAVGIEAGQHGAVGRGDAAGRIGDHAAAGVVGDARQLRAVVPDGAVHGAELVVDHLARALEVALGVQAGALEAHPGDVAVLAQHLDRPVPEVHVQAAAHGAALAVGRLLAGGLAALLLLE